MIAVSSSPTQGEPASACTGKPRFRTGSELMLSILCMRERSKNFAIRGTNLFFKKIRVVHVLDGHARREEAKDYIW